MTKTEEAAFERCMDFLAQMIEKYEAEVETPDEAAEPEHPRTEDSSSLPSNDSS